MHRYLRQFAESFGVHGLNPPQRMPNTERALAMAEYARDAEQLTPFRALVMDAYWRAGRDIESPTVLGDIARQAGMDPQEAVLSLSIPAYAERIERTRREASSMGVTGIPTFFFGRERVEGCQPYEVLARAATRAGASRRPS